MLFPHGTSLGRYRIISSLGSGGMGEVYCAEDTLLGRQVAIKVLPDHLSEEKARALKHIAVEEDRTMREILEELVDNYIDSHRETLELLKIPGFYKKLTRSSEEARKGARGKKLNELDR